MELRPGEYWIEDLEAKAKGELIVTADPSHASTIAEDDRLILRETLEAFPGARVVKVRVTVVEMPLDSRSS